MSTQRGFWQHDGPLTDKKRTRGGHAYFRHRTTGLWWSRDTAGHGGSAFKVYTEDGKGDLIWIADADCYGDFIHGKHKGAIGRIVTLQIQ
jgi:hypothetical protein